MANGATAPTPRILHIAEKPIRRRDLRTALEKEGFGYDAAPNVETGCKLLASQRPDLILLEQTHSWSIAEPLIEQARGAADDGGIPIIVVGREDESDELVALALGADDYVAQGRMTRLIARIKVAMRRRNHHSPPESSHVVEAGPLRLDDKRYQACVEGVGVYLTPSEFKLLREIVSANGRVVHRDHLLRKVFRVTGPVESRRIDVHVAGLRKKLGPASDWLQTVRTLGYVWRQPVAAAR